MEPFHGIEAINHVVDTVALVGSRIAQSHQRIKLFEAFLGLLTFNGLRLIDNHDRIGLCNNIYWSTRTELIQLHVNHTSILKASVLKKSLETNDLSIERKEGKIRFPWFTNHGIDGEAKAYMQLVSGIAKRAKMLTRVTATESVSDNEKFTMRLFLVSLNFKGEEYKFARKFLLRNLSGNSSWRTEDAKARHDARKVQQEIEAPEVTIEHLSEGGEDDAELSE